MHWLLEGAFIVLSVGLAFGVAEFRERHANSELAARILRSLQAEVEHNLAEVEPFLPFHLQWMAALEKAAGSSDSGQTGIDVYLGVRPPYPRPGAVEYPTEVRRGAWDGALTTGALRLLDYDVVAALSEIYQVQNFYGDQIERVVNAATSTTAFEPGSRRVSVRQLALDMNTLTFAEKLLLDLYKKHLPAVRRAAAAH